MKNLALIALLCAVGYLAYCQYFVTNKDVSVSNAIPESIPSPAPPPKEEPSPAPSPTLAPEAKPEPTPAEEVTAVDWLLQHPELNPKTVALLESYEFPIVINGRSVGKTTVAAGAAGKLLSWTNHTVIAEFAGSPRELADTSTDFLQQVVQIHREQKNLQQPVAEPLTENPVSSSDFDNTTRISPQETPILFDLHSEVPALKLAAYLKAHRSEFDSLVGTSIKVTGVVEDMKVDGSIGQMVTAEISLRTQPDLPKIKLFVHASEFMKDSSGDRFEMRVQKETLEGRFRDTRYPYRNYYYWYYNNGYWRSRAASTEWVPIISIGQPLIASGTLSKFHIHVELEGAKLDKGQ